MVRKVSGRRTTALLLAARCTAKRESSTYISVLGDGDARQKTMDGLKSSSGFIRHELAMTVNLRNTPELIFLEDDSIEYGVRMSKIIDDVNSEDQHDAEDEE